MADPDIFCLTAKSILQSKKLKWTIATRCLDHTDLLCWWYHKAESRGKYIAQPNFASMCLSVFFHHLVIVSLRSWPDMIPQLKRNVATLHMACCQTSAGFNNKEQDLWSNWILEFGFDTPGFQTNSKKENKMDHHLSLLSSSLQKIRKVPDRVAKLISRVKKMTNFGVCFRQAVSCSLCESAKWNS
jgi:hypothetical protein